MLRSLQSRNSHWRDETWPSWSSPWPERSRSKWHRWLLRLHDPLLGVCEGNCRRYSGLPLSSSPTPCDLLRLCEGQANNNIDIQRQGTQPLERSDQRWMLRWHRQIPHRRMRRHSGVRSRRIRRTSWPRACQTRYRCQGPGSPERVPRQQSLSVRMHLARPLLRLCPQSHGAARVWRHHELWLLYSL